VQPAAHFLEDGRRRKRRGPRHDLSAYDATYLALAEVLDASLVTADAGLADWAARRLGDERVLIVR
jgi:predicted nucleic acid-binding protein